DVEIPEAVEDVVMRALSDIEARFQSAHEMSEAIRAALAPVPIERVFMVPGMAEQSLTAEDVAPDSPGDEGPVPAIASVEQANLGVAHGPAPAPLADVPVEQADVPATALVGQEMLP